MRTVRYLRDAQRALRAYSDMAPRLRKAITDYAADPSAHANNVRQLTGQAGKRMRVGDWRIIFEETEAEIVVTKIGRRGDIYR